MKAENMNQGTRIVLKVNGQDGNAVFVCIDRSTRLKKLMDAYCDHHSLEINSTAFLFNEHKVQEELSPNEVRVNCDSCKTLLFILLVYDLKIYFWCRWKWRMGMKLMQSFVIRVDTLSSRSKARLVFFFRNTSYKYAIADTTVNIILR